MSRLLGSGSGGQGALEHSLTRELRAFTGAQNAFLLRVDERAGTATPVAADPGKTAASEPVPLDRAPAVADALTAELAIRLDGDEAANLGSAIGSRGITAAALLLP
ncbi:MAG: hypothetical protein QOJ57_94, partial [Thermoleophilaceae bacterium]|nr:hypothetical protein [Thermoleophilaceae bacterium]